MIIDPSVLTLFLVSSVLIMIVPGPDMIYILANSVSEGRRSGIVASLGVASGAIVHFIAAALGISALILASEFAYNVVRFMGAGYLAWVGLQYITTKSTYGAAGKTKHRKRSQIYRQGVLANLLNPKAILFNLSFVPQFVSVGYSSAWAQILVLGAILIIIGLVINLSIVIMADRLSTLMNNRQFSIGGHFGKFAGVLLIGFAFYIALARRPVQ